MSNEQWTVQKYFDSENIDLDFLEGMEDGSTYWDSCLNFVTENWTRLITELSEKQNNWLNKILEDCVEKRIIQRQGQ
jgi:hypothetical protein